MNTEWNKRNGSQLRARMIENQTNQSQVFLMTDRVSQLWCWIGWTGFQLIHLVDKKSQLCSTTSQWMRKQRKEMVLNSEPRWVRTKQSKVRCSSWLTESANYDDELVEPVSNLSIWLIKNPKLGQKVSKWIRNQTKETVLNSEPDEWEPNKARSGIPHDWHSQQTMVLNRFNRFPAGPSDW